MMDGLEKFAERIACWPRLAALAFGLLAALGFPPIHAWPLGLISTAGLVWLVSRAASRRRAFALGWLFGVAHFTLANNWIATAFTYQAEMPAALGWVAVPLLSLYQHLLMITSNSQWTVTLPNTPYLTLLRSQLTLNDVGDSLINL